MKNRLILKQVLNTLLLGWVFMLISLALVIFFPAVAKEAAILTLIVGLFIFLRGFGLSIAIDTDDLFWESIDKVDEEYERWKKRGEDAIAYKNVYLNLILKENAVSNEELKNLLEEEKNKL